MKKLYAILLILVLLISVLASCGETDTPKEEPTPSEPEEQSEPTQLQTPKVKISEEGVATWKAISGATGYVVMWDGFEMDAQTELSFELSDGESIQVKAVSTDPLKTESEYSELKTYIEEDVMSDFY